MITIQALKIHVRGVVQGVGFRPFIYQQAQANGLKGWVRNTSGDVTIAVEGDSGSLERFLAALHNNPPPQSHIESIQITPEIPGYYLDFEILDSQVEPEEYQLVSPDLATCRACQKEIFSPADRRYHYPFTNCTNCGPRFTIIEDIPYDRPRTTMSHFRMCPACQKEYDDPLDRRFHAQPNACPDCGPRLELRDAAGRIISTDNVITQSARLIRWGNILAIKGLGGFLLACDATNDKAVKRLRDRKQRAAKPFAVMLKGLEAAERYCLLNDLEANTLSSAAAPIVLLRKAGGTNERFPDSKISELVAPGLKYLGVMLPYTPLHHLLMNETNLPLVMTSGNLSEEPIAKDNDEALSRLGKIADYFVLHNRGIYSRYDDSVVTVEQDKVCMVRRARGFAPYPVHLSFKAKPVLACGAELKNTFCLTRDNHAFVSQHIGDMENPETLDHFGNTIEQYQRLFRIRPEIIACDLHPDYLPTKWAGDEAKKNRLPRVLVQHHHAHIVSCLAENEVEGPVIGVAFDGTGLGTDGRIWGSEFMIADYHRFQRLAHLQYLPLPGGSFAIQKPYRTAIGYLYSVLGNDAINQELPCVKGANELEVDLIKRQIDQGINTPWTSSSGRLFDAVSSLLGVCQKVEYEGQAAIELEAVADEVKVGETYSYEIEAEEGVKIIKIGKILTTILSDLKQGVPAGIISARFHNTLAGIIVEVSLQLGRETGLKQVALSGGVFQNRRLVSRVIQGLKGQGLIPLTHSQLPCNDGCISLGQAVIASQSDVEKVGGK
jgi:hydrogenase maturation protein HypF